MWRCLLPPVEPQWQLFFALLPTSPRCPAVLPPAPTRSLSPLCTDVATLKAGVAEGRRNVMALAQALLGDVLDPSVFDGALR